MMPAFRFIARPTRGGFILHTDDGVTVGYVTLVSKDMLTKFFVTTVATHTHCKAGETKNTVTRTH